MNTPSLAAADCSSSDNTVAFTDDDGVPWFRVPTGPVEYESERVSTLARNRWDLTVAEVRCRGDGSGWS